MKKLEQCKNKTLESSSLSLEAETVGSDTFLFNGVFTVQKKISGPFDVSMWIFLNKPDFFLIQNLYNSLHLCL